ncbi:MAG: hypothetical protein H0V50_06605, partial [Thermoleophilaceae bacterium]|nr:hypothetical protein [Thermoleophilaceae bacterium]
GALALVLTTGMIALATVALSPAGARDAVTYHLDRPVQVESTTASVLLALDAVGAGTAQPVSSHRSDGLLHPFDGPLSAVFAALLLAALALCTAAAARGAQALGAPADARVLVLGSLTAVASFAALGKVLSPQFLIWLVPLAALALAWRMHALAAVAAGAIALTLAEFPAHYADVVAREPLAVWLVAARNVLLLLALALALRAASASPVAARGEAAARWRLPARRRRPRPPRR